MSPMKSLLVVSSGVSDVDSSSSKTTGERVVILSFDLIWPQAEAAEILRQCP